MRWLAGCCHKRVLKREEEGKKEKKGGGRRKAEKAGREIIHKNIQLL